MTQLSICDNEVLRAAEGAASGSATPNERAIPRSAADSGTGPDDKDVSDSGPTVGPGTDIPVPDDIDLTPLTDDGSESRAIGGPAN